MPRNRRTAAPVVQTPLSGLHGRALLLPTSLALGGVAAGLVVHYVLGPEAGTTPLVAAVGGIVAAYLATARHKPKELSKLVGFGAAVVLLTLTVAAAPSLRQPSRKVPTATQAKLLDGLCRITSCDDAAKPPPKPKPKRKAKAGEGR
jgi:hypothetical protein